MPLIPAGRQPTTFTRRFHVASSDPAQGGLAAIYHRGHVEPLGDTRRIVSDDDTPDLVEVTPAGQLTLSACFWDNDAGVVVRPDDAPLYRRYLEAEPPAQIQTPTFEIPLGEDPRASFYFSQYTGLSSPDAHRITELSQQVRRALSCTVQLALYATVEYMTAAARRGAAVLARAGIRASYPRHISAPSAQEFADELRTVGFYTGTTPLVLLFGSDADVHYLVSALLVRGIDFEYRAWTDKSTNGGADLVEAGHVSVFYWGDGTGLGFATAVEVHGAERDETFAIWATLAPTVTVPATGVMGYGVVNATGAARRNE